MRFPMGPRRGGEKKIKKREKFENCFLFLALFGVNFAPDK
jgi:hypothetical protein